VAKRQLYNLGEIARRFGGDLIGDAATRISQVASLDAATASEISFVSHPRFRYELAKTKAERDILKKAIGFFTKEPT